MFFSWTPSCVQKMTKCCNQIYYACLCMLNRFRHFLFKAEAYQNFKKLAPLCMIIFYSMMHTNLLHRSSLLYISSFHPYTVRLFSFLYKECFGKLCINLLVRTLGYFEYEICKCYSNASNYHRFPQIKIILQEGMVRVVSMEWGGGGGGRRHSLDTGWCCYIVEALQNWWSCTCKKTRCSTGDLEFERFQWLSLYLESHYINILFKMASMIKPVSLSFVHSPLSLCLSLSSASLYIFAIAWLFFHFIFLISIVLCYATSSSISFSPLCLSLSVSLSLSSLSVSLCSFLLSSPSLSLSLLSLSFSPLLFLHTPSPSVSALLVPPSPPALPRPALPRPALPNAVYLLVQSLMQSYHHNGYIHWEGPSTEKLANGSKVYH